MARRGKRSAKGKVPPQLRPFLFRRSARGAVAFGRRTRSSGGGSFGRARGFGHRLASEVKHKLLEMGLAFGVGYLAPRALSDLGVGQAIYQNVKPYASAVDAMWNASSKYGDPTPWGNGGLVGFAKVGGVADGARRVYAATKRGGFTGGNLVGLALDLGLALDPVEGMSGSRGSGGGYW